MTCRKRGSDHEAVPQGAARRHPRGGVEPEGGHTLTTRQPSRVPDALMCRAPGMGCWAHGQTEPSAEQTECENTASSRRSEVPGAGALIRCSTGVGRETVAPSPAPFLFSINAQLEGCRGWSSGELAPPGSAVSSGGSLSAQLSLEYLQFWARGQASFLKKFSQPLHPSASPVGWPGLPGAHHLPQVG